METLHDIYSRIANDIQDNTFKLVTRGEYVMMANMVANTLSKNIDLYVKELLYKATAEEKSFVLPKSLSPYTTTDHISIPFGEHYHINRLLKVIRNNQDCREVSWNAIESASRGNAAFKVNDTQLDFRFYATTLSPSGDITLHWAQSLAEDEEITIFALCDVPMQTNFYQSNQAGADFTPKWSEFKDYTPIPSLLSNVFYRLLLKEVISLLVTRVGDTWNNRYMLASSQALLELNDVKRYIINLKDKSSFPQIQPLKWLPENPTSDYTGNPNIPPEFTSIIIL